MPYKLSYNKKYNLREKIEEAINTLPDFEKKLEKALKIVVNKPKMGDKFYPELFPDIDILYDKNSDFRYIIIVQYNLVYAIKKDFVVEIFALERCTHTCCT